MYIIRKLGGGPPNKYPFKLTLPNDWIKWMNHKRKNQLKYVKITIKGDKLEIEPIDEES